MSVNNLKKVHEVVEVAIVEPSSTEKAIKTAAWATRMTTRHIGFVTGGKRIGSKKVKPVQRWQLVGFPGPGGQESAGIVDLLAMRKNHKVARGPFMKGDLLEIVVLQVKGGSASLPTTKDNMRLAAVAKYYKARSVVLAQWVKGQPPEFFWLVRA